jgi:hypothetical protein
MAQLIPLKFIMAEFRFFLLLEICLLEYIANSVKSICTTYLHLQTTLPDACKECFASSD